MSDKKIKIYLDNCCYNRPFDEQNQDLIRLETERFIYLIKREHFDYTEWQRTLWDNLTIDEVYQLAADREKARRNDSR